ncbi:hypothetical protein DFH07DRAFT_389695 [Mycena maculata]|uniref:Uncharacterized protein n=1 Tax=Mycena maculata TaxID=230809 RepID=A0AAD7NZI9_9AGAR|nr:hypothetical protein DFH07DRAFT_389695 [Mycena maculata]
MNRNPAETHYYGDRVITLNGGLAAQYEETARGSDTEANLGFLLGLTFLHELVHVWIRHVLAGFLPPDWETPPLLEGHAGESGRALEWQLLGGDLKVTWDEGDSFLVDRYKRISGIWLAPPEAHARSVYRRIGSILFSRRFLLRPDVEIIGSAHLADFHRKLAGEHSINLWAALADVVRIDAGAEPEFMEHRQLEIRGPILRASPASPGTVCVERIYVDIPEPAAQCGIEKARAEGARPTPRMGTF